MAIYGSNFDYGESPYYKDDGGIINEDSLFVFFPNWREPVKLTYHFDTIISNSRYDCEQRKSLLSRPTRKQSFLLTEDIDASKIWNYLLRMQASSLYCPIYTECIKFLDTGSIIGKTELNFEDITYFYNIKNYTTAILLYDIRQIVSNEILYIDSIVMNKVKFFNAVAGDHLYQTSRIYPLYNCYITNKSRRDVTDKLTEIELELTEIMELTYIGTYGGS